MENWTNYLYQGVVTSHQGSSLALATVTNHQLKDPIHIWIREPCRDFSSIELDAAIFVGILFDSSHVTPTDPHSQRREKSLVFYSHCFCVRTHGNWASVA